MDKTKDWLEVYTTFILMGFHRKQRIFTCSADGCLNSPTVNGS